MTNTHILLGPATHEKDTYIDQYIKNAYPETKHAEKQSKSPHLELLKYYLADDDIINVARAITTPSLFTEQTIIILFQAERIRGPQAQPLLKALAHVDPSVSVLCVTDEYKVSEQLSRVARGQKKIFYPPRPSVGKELEAIFKSHFIEVDQEVLDYIVEFAQDGALGQEEIVRNLCHFFAEDRQIYLSLSQVVACISGIHAENIFSITQHVIDRRFDRCYRIISDQYHMGVQPVLIIAGLRYQLQVGLHVALHHRGDIRGSQDELFSRFKIMSERARERYIRFSRMYSVESLRALLIASTHIDLNIREHSDSELTKTYLLMFLYVLQRTLIHEQSKKEVKGKRTMQKNEGSLFLHGGFLHGGNDYNSNSTSFFSW